MGVAQEMFSLQMSSSTTFQPPSNHTKQNRPSILIPDDDDISYFHLKEMPSIHNILATLFFKILFEKHAVPETWHQRQNQTGTKKWGHFFPE